MDNTSPHRRVVAVTGAASGLGRAIAKAFVDHGDEVHAIDIAPDRLEEARGEIGDCRGAIADVADPHAVNGVVENIINASGRLDVLVNNAGVFDGNARIDHTTHELWTRVLDINLNGCFYGTKAAAAVMVRQQSGRIINVSSVAGLRAGPDGVAYSASKAAILSLTRSVAIDVARFGVTVNAISPGAFPTGIRENSEEILRDDAPAMDANTTMQMSQETFDYLLPARRRGRPEELAATALFLASDLAAYINGENIIVDGGWCAV
ncbi:MAG TPA: SDR family NAD(P)-dependent oxidoreductase [Baekduia sp.]|nr:SDR family NAD(P)-dependent oxidoreductase [Baekduia sp.]